ncbi:hypothetical protein GALMADRAFT_143359 [Galerina marginata CBS 339.88]|uniref:BTB domain-containing protein n=1 Tax=Galerina marginata (strain CBS 339.88) TaxID=685588 RepID=A0A067SZ36_GALM3|nr:hypothetical protein GALMADRAFT_143359 [Galerina marginata CBS 339.88]
MPAETHLARPDRQNPAQWLENVEENNFQKWLQDLNMLFMNVETRYADVVWKIPVDKTLVKKFRKVWGHQAVIYARAHWMVRDIYLPGTPSQIPSLSFRSIEIPPNHHNPAFIQRLRYYYTGQSTTAGGHPGLGGGVDTSPSLKLLSKDFISMCRSQQFTDVQIFVGPPSAISPVFHCHRFVLSSRSSYFRGVLANSDVGDTADPTIINLPSPHIKAVSFSFILGYIYGGILEKSRSEYNILTALSIFRGSLYLSLSTLEEQMLAEISVNMLHDLYHGPLSDDSYMNLLSGHWVTLACRCPQCAHHAPFILEFALASDIKNEILEYGARCSLVALFGDGWYTARFSALPPNTTHLVLGDIRRMITPLNVFPLLFAAERALTWRGAFSKGTHWYQSLTAMIISVRRSVERVLCTEPRACFESPWLDMPQRSGGNTAIQAGWIAQALQRGEGLGKFSSVSQTLLALPDLDTRCRDLLERTEPEIQKLMRPSFSKNVLVSPEELGYSKMNLTPEAMQNDVDRPDSITTRRSPQSSLYHSVLSEFDSEHNLRDGDRASYQVSALDLACINSLYSYASSRTISTEYGIYYIRRAISRETVLDWDAGSSVRRRRSCESF